MVINLDKKLSNTKIINFYTCMYKNRQISILNFFTSIFSMYYYIYIVGWYCKFKCWVLWEKCNYEILMIFVNV